MIQVRGKTSGWAKRTWSRQSVLASVAALRLVAAEAV